MIIRPAILLFAVFSLQSVSLFAAEASSAKLTYEQHVRPIFKAACFHCHGEEEENAGGLDLRLVRLMLAGGDSGPAVVSGDLTASLIWDRIASDEMPEGDKKLTAAEKQTVQQWIEQGARTARPEPDDVNEARFTLEELDHWAFRPVERPAVPAVSDEYEIRNAIDAFVAEQLQDAGLHFSESADRRTLVRRVTFDLTGIPPTSDEIEVFISDQSADAYERLVDRLLASPEFGVRWGRHWLDVAGYAESNGGPANDRKRPHAWRYRDYVINAFNADKPVNDFFVEQIAGDELLELERRNSEAELTKYSNRAQELLTATGFLRMGPDATQDSNTLADRNMAVADAINIVSTAMFGLTVGCAQCHDHKYDPIAIDDYYQFRAIFDPAFHLTNWRQPESRLVNVTPQSVLAERDEIEAKAKALDDDLNKRRDAVCKRIQDEKITDVPEPDREATREALFASANDRTQRQKELLDLYPMVKPIGTIRGLLVEYDSKSYREFEKELAAIAEIRATKPPLHQIMVTTEQPDVVPTSTVFFRGNPEIPKQEVTPGEVFVLNRHGRSVEIAVNDEQLTTTGRRLAYAEKLTDGTHPLTARVFVNRIWMHHFGRGLVDTPSDFGAAGSKPTHPRLLDWLADDFVRHGWSQKRLHRMILMSTTYRQSSRRTEKQDAIDPENELLGRMNLRRLEAEAIRDAILAAGGQLNRELGGASAPVTVDAAGKTVIGKRLIKDGLKAGVDRANADAYRRSAYIETNRSVPLDTLKTFDQPVMNPNCSVRRPSTVATQSLWFLNDEFIVEASEQIATSILNDDESVQDRHVEDLFVRLFAQSPTNYEVAMCQQFVREQIEDLSANNDEAKQSAKGQHEQLARQAFATLCQTLFASNRFLYLD
ncbi:MAG: PSD1 domain-containing protein [Planctomycetales bacterium]|nr:PSD1 domain-containing protein [Planctomycetales bacterium]